MIRKILKAIVNPGHALAGLVRKLWFLFHNDERFLKLIYFLEMGRRLDLKNPQRFTEKIQWLKIHDRRHEYPILVDKLSVKNVVARIIGERHIIPTLGVWNNFDEIDFSKLPDKFVLKTNHGSAGGGVVICHNKEELDFEAIRFKFERGLRHNAYNKYREWPYKNIKPRIFAEELLEVKEGIHADISDYKFFCFNGEPKYCQVIQDRRTKETIDFFDMEWHHEDFIGLNPKAVHAERVPERPKTLNQMIEIARKLSVGKSFARIDLYEIGDACYFGEITLYPASGLGKFTPQCTDRLFGEILQLPTINS